MKTRGKISNIRNDEMQENILRLDLKCEINYNFKMKSLA